ncbi:MAG: type II toxin-antitoxin system HicB family antitoxin [Melioribacteraceae bacterium]|nr:type II toxin-antitoxin system HicB family antitoxin [Melioribacteraceae bacterium]
MYRYEIIIYWSLEDKAFIAEVPELSGCIAHGNTYTEALKNAEVAIELWIETAKEFLEVIPKPKGRKLQYA